MPITCMLAGQKAAAKQIAKETSGKHQDIVKVSNNFHTPKVEVSTRKVSKALELAGSFRTECSQRSENEAPTLLNIPSSGDNTSQHPFDIGGGAVCADTSQVREVEPSSNTEEELGVRVTETTTSENMDTILGSLIEEESLDDPIVRKFNLFMAIMILVNIVVIAIEIDYKDEDEEDLSKTLVWMILNSFFIVVFLFEMGVRIRWEGKNWLYSVWNWFDVMVIGLAVVDVWILSFVGHGNAPLNVLTLLRIIRLVRLVRLVKLVRFLRSLYVMIYAFAHAMQSIGFLLCVMMFGLLIYAIFATLLIARSGSFEDVRFPRMGSDEYDTVEDRFGTISRSMYTMFELMTLEGLTEVARPLVTAQPAIFLFIVSFIVIFTFGLLNMIIASVVEKTIEQNKKMNDFSLDEARTQMAEQLVSMQQIFSGTGSLTFEQFETAVNTNEEVRQLLRSMCLPVQETRELFRVFDSSHNGTVNIAEFMDGCAKLRADAPSTWDSVATHSNVNLLLTRVASLEDRLGATINADKAWRKSADATMAEILGHLKKASPQELRPVTA